MKFCSRHQVLAGKVLYEAVIQCFAMHKLTFAAKISLTDALQWMTYLIKGKH